MQYREECPWRDEGVSCRAHEPSATNHPLFKLQISELRQIKSGNTMHLQGRLYVSPSIICVILRIVQHGCAVVWMLMCIPALLIVHFKVKMVAITVNCIPKPKYYRRSFLCSHINVQYIIPLPNPWNLHFPLIHSYLKVVRDPGYYWKVKCTYYSNVAVIFVPPQGPHRFGSYKRMQVGTDVR